MSAKVNSRVLVGAIFLAFIAILGGMFAAQYLNTGKKLIPNNLMVPI